MVYSGDEGGRIGMRIVPLDGRDGKWELAGQDASWSASGREFFYVGSPNATLFVIPVETDPTVVLGRAEPLFEIDVNANPQADFAVSADGKRILLLQAVEKTSGPPGITVIHNWYSEFRDDMP